MRRHKGAHLQPVMVVMIPSDEASGMAALIKLNKLRIREHAAYHAAVDDDHAAMNQLLVRKPACGIGFLKKGWLKIVHLKPFELAIKS
ncbi:MAG: hypothetical protein IPH54_04355 [Rhodoferax sp.]|nr:hypothetical protein [Rhodoferax sp.]